MLFLFRDSLAFATEPVFASLANILGVTDNVPVPVPPQLDNFSLFEVEIKYGLVQVSVDRVARNLLSDFRNTHLIILF